MGKEWDNEMVTVDLARRCLLEVDHLDGSGSIFDEFPLLLQPRYDDCLYRWTSTVNDSQKSCR